MPVASQAVLMEHLVDPKQAILDEVAPFIDDVEPIGRQILVGTYLRPEKTQGGLLLPDGVNTARGEDRYQGKVQMVLKFGPMAFEPFGYVDPDEGVVDFQPKPKLHDWILIRVGDSFQFLLGKQPMRLVIDRNVRAILNRPD